MVYRLVSDFLLVHLFTGPKPRDVLAQLTAYIGRMPKTPAKFALGYTLCRETSEDGMPSVQHDYARLTEDLEASDHENFTNFTHENFTNFTHENFTNFYPNTNQPLLLEC